MAKCAFLSTKLQIHRLTKSRERVEIKVFKIKLVISNVKQLRKKGFFFCTEFIKRSLIRLSSALQQKENTDKILQEVLKNQGLSL